MKPKMQRPTRLKWPIKPTRLTRLRCPKVGDVDCHSGVFFCSSGLMTVAPRLGTLFATRVWTFPPSRLMAAPRLGVGATWVWTLPRLRLMAALALGATRVWTFPPSRMMAVKRLGATRVWTFPPSRLMAAPRLGTLFATRV